MSGRPPSYLRARHQPTQEQARESDFQRTVMDLLRWKRYPLIFHDTNPRGSVKGFPDIIACKPGHVVALELKSIRGKPSVEQLAWIASMDGARVDAMLAYPKDLAAIEGVLL